MTDEEAEAVQGLTDRIYKIGKEESLLLASDEKMAIAMLSVALGASFCLLFEKKEDAVKAIDHLWLIAYKESK